MATLLHFLRSLAVTLLASFVLLWVGLELLVSGLWTLRLFPVGRVSESIYVQVSRFFTVFGGGSRTEGIVAIALTLSFVISLFLSFLSYKRSQRNAWHVIATED